ncbi:MAG: SprT-like domain-containing protein [Deltaproteobacteria bacterium]|nr:SprT-like domain-containing protein [Deltaproteobacteria bacterium]
MKLMQLSFFNLFKSKKPQKKKRAPTRSPKKRTERSDEFLKSIWDKLWMEYFPTRNDLAAYTIRWSNRRQKRTLASCSLENRRIVVAQELNHPKYSMHLEPLIYHEMCHAVLGYEVSQSGEKRLWHGPEFKRLERHHPGIKTLDKWIHTGGWLSAVRAHRAREAHKKRKFQDVA